MKITGIRSGIVKLPVEALRGVIRNNPNPTWPVVWLRVETDQGIEGIGVSFFGETLTRSLKCAIDDLGALLIGDDPLLVEAVAQKLRNAAGSSAGPGGIFTLAIAALDIALWDIKGKALNLPLWKLLGGARNRIAAYSSGDLMKGLSLDEVVAAAAKLKDKGWREIKTQLAISGNKPAQEIDRVRRIREAIGPDIKLMCDVNQLWRPEQAIDMGRRIEEAGVRLGWLEDATTHDDLAGNARVTSALSTPTAGGEYVWGMVPFRQIIEARSFDIVMIDLIRVGGITPWMKVAGMAEAFNLPVVSHMVPEIHLHLVAAAPNGLTVEYMAWLTPMYKEVPLPQNGELMLPAAPGLGLEFDQAALDRYGA